MTDTPRRWTAGPDPTTELPDPTEVAPVPAEEPGPDPEPSHWPPVVDLVVRYAPVGTGSTWTRLWSWLTVHPRAWELDEVKSDEDYWELRSDLRHDLFWRRLLAVTAAGALAVVGWRLLGDHGMWPLVIGSAWATIWYTAKGAVLVRRSAGRTAPAHPEMADGPSWSGPPVRPAGPDERSDESAEDSPVRSRRFLRLVRSDRPEPEPRRTAPPVRRRAEPVRPDWLTEGTIERKLRSAHKPLRSSKPEVDGGPVVQLLAARHMGNGWAFTVELPEDVTALEVIGSRDRVARAFGTNVHRMLMAADQDHGGILTCWRCDDDPLTGPPTWSRLLELDEVNCWDGFVLGKDLYGQEVRCHPIGTHTLISGEQGSGKSVLTKLLVAHLAMDPHHRLVLVDPNGAEWAIWSGVGLYFGGTKGLAAALDFVRDLAENEIERRARRLGELKELYPARIPELKLYDFLARDPAEDLAPITVVVGESLALYKGDHADEWYKHFSTLNEQGRKYGLQVIYEAQIASAEKMGGTGVRDLCNMRFCGGVRTGQGARMGLGDTWKGTGMDPTALLPYRHAGAFFATGAALRTGDPWVLIKANFTDDNEGREVARRALALRQRERPQLLPDWRPPAEAKAEAPPVLDLEPLRRVIDVIRPATVMLATEVATRLADRHPVEHGDVTTLADLNAVLAPYQLRTQQFTTPDDPARRNRLRLATLEARLKRLEAGRTRTPAQPRAWDPLEARRTPSDLPLRHGQSVTMRLPPIEGRLAKPQVNDPRTGGTP